MIRILPIVIFLVTQKISYGQHLETEINDNSSVSIISQNDFLPRAYGLIHFEGQNEQNVNFLNDDTNVDDTRKQIIFKDDTFNPDESNNASGVKRKKKKRRRKPKQFVPFGAGQINGIPQHQYLDPGNPQNIGTGNRYPNFGKPIYRPPPRPSLASQALSSVTDALTSIARYDDYQCVPRLLCEAAGGGGLGTSSLLQSVNRLQPLLTVLSAYNGVSTNPLFVFGRAVFLGVSSKENSASCRYAYPLCPTDTEQLVHYLNNHNGGFFRFFSAPQQEEQSLEQFYNQLSSYGLYQPNQNFNENGYPYIPGQSYGSYHQNQITNQFFNVRDQHYGIYQPNQIPTERPFIQNQSYGFYRPGLYPTNNKQSYGPAYPYSNQIQFKNLKESKIEKRIQNKPNTDFIQDDEEPSWNLPLEHKVKDSSINTHGNKFNGVRQGKTLIFPESVYNNVVYRDFVMNFNPYAKNEHNNNRNGKKLRFPKEFEDNFDYDNYNENLSIDNENYYYNENNGNRDFIFPEIRDYKRYPYNTFNNKFLNENRYDIKNKDKAYDDGLQTVYIVRGNGDPNNPEIVKIKPGQIIK